MEIQFLKSYRHGLLIAFIAIITFAIVSCEKALLGDDPANEPIENFEIFWKALDEKYVFFDFKEINWQQVYHEFRPKVHNGMSDQELFYVLRDMIYLLRDGHTSLSTPFETARNKDWYLNSPPNYNWDIIERQYLGDDYTETGALLHTWLDSVGYIHYGSFSAGVSHNQLTYVLDRYADAKGLIFDVRNNAGGNTQTAERIAARFTDQTVLTQYWLYKNGTAHDDFSIPEEKYLEPFDGLRFTKPVVVLTNRKCYSATNDFVLMMSTLPNVTLLGDTTGGGGGFPFNAELPNGWQYRFSSTMTIAPDGFNVEHGIPPTIQVDMTPVDEMEEIDTLIESALEYLN